MILEGLIIKGIGGFYYVETSDGIYECRARGIFRKKGKTPLAGDKVKIDTEVIIDSEIEKTAAIDEILPRKNFLIRPPVANIDNLFIISSIVEPSPDTLIIDKTMAAAEVRDIEPILIITKSDLTGETACIDNLKHIYDMAGIKCIVVSSLNHEGTDEVKALLAGKTSAFTGNSGVGKSTLLNAIFPKLDIETGEISQKLGRGKHTTREVELHKTDNNGYVADTPGFSTFDMGKYDIDDKDELIYGFRDMMKYFGQCKFTSCSHTGEKGCAIKKAVDDEEIAKSRYASYLSMYNEVKDIKKWQLQK